MRCLHPKLKDGQIGTCESQGVAGPVVGTLGSLQALEALRLLLGISKPGSSLLSIDGKTMSILEHRLKKNPECPVCSSRAIEEEVLSLSVNEFLQAQDRYHLIDLRSEAERETHPLPPGTEATAWGAPGTEAPLPELPASKTPVLLCRRGMMAYRVQAELGRSGISAIVLRGGMEAWIKR
jgi:rhodanese-related sulfurtransferase